MATKSTKNTGFVDYVLSVAEVYINKKSPVTDEALSVNCRCDESDQRSGRNHADAFAVFRSFDFELDHAIGLGKQGMVPTTSHIVTGMNPGAALTDDNAASFDCLTTKHLHTQALGIGIATVTCTTACFFMCHT